MEIQNNALAIPQTPVIRLTKIRLVIFSISFVALSVLTPYITHQFNLAGPAFLPMHFFVLLAGLLFGWRLGLIVGLITPWISFATSGMPPYAILPQLTLEIGTYGFMAGLLRQNLKLNPWFSLILAIILGRFVLLFGFLSIPSLITTIKAGLPGILIQIIILPLFTYFITNFLKKDN